MDKEWAGFWRLPHLPAKSRPCPPYTQTHTHPPPRHPAEAKSLSQVWHTGQKAEGPKETLLLPKPTPAALPATGPFPVSGRSQPEAQPIPPGGLTLLHPRPWNSHQGALACLIKVRNCCSLPRLTTPPRARSLSVLGTR